MPWNAPVTDNIKRQYIDHYSFMDEQLWVLEHMTCYEVWLPESRQNYSCCLLRSCIDCKSSWTQKLFPVDFKMGGDTTLFE